MPQAKGKTESMYDALKVITLSEPIQAFLSTADPKAFQQAKAAIEAVDNTPWRIVRDAFRRF